MASNTKPSAKRKTKTTAKSRSSSPPVDEFEEDAEILEKTERITVRFGQELCDFLASEVALGRFLNRNEAVRACVREKFDNRKAQEMRMLMLRAELLKARSGGDIKAILDKLDDYK